MGRREGPPSTLDAIVSDYVTQRARELIRQIDQQEVSLFGHSEMNTWIGQAVEILRELTRNA